YCSKECQVSHWSLHKKDCRHEYMKSDWQPDWVRKNRSPAISDTSHPTRLILSGSRKPEYIWGNTPAVDCLQLSHNEGVLESLTRDFNVCFAASGDIRNMVMTVNNLPENYQGRCNILLNDHSPIITTRNILILYALLHRGPTIESAAELALHLMYSARLRAADSSELRARAQVVYGDMFPCQDDSHDNSEGPMILKTLKIRGKGKLYATQVTAHLYKEPLRMLKATHSLKDTQNALHSAMLNPKRIDYLERYFCGLKPAHRLSDFRFREKGVLFPFSVDVTEFQEPNPLMFSPDGEWLTRDDANPLFSWNINDVLHFGKEHGLDPADTFGCLFFYVKGQFMEFARRVERFNINIHVSQLEASVAAHALSRGMLNPIGKESKFDRVETSNVVDYIKIPRLLNDWSPLLNRTNVHATLLMYSMNWFLYQPAFYLLPLFGSNSSDISTYASQGTDLKSVFAQGTQSRMATVVGHCEEPFIENSEQLLSHLSSPEIKSAFETNKMHMRIKNRIHPRRYGISLSDHPSALPIRMTREEFYNTYMLGGCEAGVRFLEFENGI
ncbi:hypothetical protein BDP27DRAFT_1216379, partial [Rhodocollybia butyracea]